ncbi:amino acid ABC transporter permease [Bradyrhizobium sp. Tv2a-2]|jgi:glutamate/aspartate transport system permease protein|uniref:amino acid ABC transporter permease n=1 Tax=Bradyrhizobium sp. Tv2a-2 TaxID=113395 RepID=UPI0004652136|nr:amino acid ABC transporter permease [Bradyrhizobium sp. Tv2a-2]
MSYRWNWGIIFEQPYLSWLLQGLGVTVALSCLAWAIALPLGTLVGSLRTGPYRAIRLLCAWYVQAFRNVPLIVQMFLWFFVFPEVVPKAVGFFLKRQLPIPEFTMGCLCLALYTSARIAEIIRSGLEAAGNGPRNAALASGMTYYQAYRYVLLPMSFRLTMPPLTSEFLAIFKNSSVALTIGVLELTAQSHQVESFTFQGFEAFTAATVLYALISWACLGIAGAVNRQLSNAGGLGTEVAIK